jgi:ribosomal protein S18 acetylase RimI-like enzyme
MPDGLAARPRSCTSVRAVSGTASPQLRLARRADAPRIARLHAESWRRHYRGAYADAFLDGDVEAERRREWSRRLQGPDHGRAATILAEQGGSLLGFVHVIFDDDPTWGALVDNIHVAFATQRSGLGRRLMAAAAEAVTERDAESGLYVWVLEQNAPAQAFYEARGGTCVERAPAVAPGGVAGRLAGAPLKLRYVWPKAQSLSRLGRDASSARRRDIGSFLTS